jgi:hypothetical protein
MIAPFSKKTLNLTLTGITTDENDLSVCPSSIYLRAVLIDDRSTSYAPSHSLIFNYSVFRMVSNYE